MSTIFISKFQAVSEKIANNLGASFFTAPVCWVPVSDMAKRYPFGVFFSLSLKWLGISTRKSHCFFHRLDVFLALHHSQRLVESALGFSRVIISQQTTICLCIFSAFVDGYGVRDSEQPARWVNDDHTLQVYGDKPYLDARWDARYHDDDHNRPPERLPNSAAI